MGKNDSTDSISTFYIPARRPTADELRALSDAILERLYERNRVFAFDEDDTSDRWEAAALVDDILEAVGIPEVQIPGQPWRRFPGIAGGTAD